MQRKLKALSHRSPFVRQPHAGAQVSRARRPGEKHKSHTVCTRRQEAAIAPDRRALGSGRKQLVPRPRTVGSMSGRGVIRRAAVLLTAVGANLSKHLVASGRRCCFALRSGTADQMASGWSRTDLRSPVAMQQVIAVGSTASNCAHRTSRSAGRRGEERRGEERRAFRSGTTSASMRRRARRRPSGSCELRPRRE